MKNIPKHVTHSPRHWVLGAVAFVAMGLAVSLEAVRRLRRAAWERLEPCLSEEDQEALMRLEGEGGPTVHAQAASGAALPSE